MKVFMKGVWIPFDSATVNRAFELINESNEAYRELFRAPNYDHILETLTYNKRPWKKSSINEVISFPRIGRTQATRAWSYFISSKLRPSNHVYIVL